jgi:hypothetical protein
VTVQLDPRTIARVSITAIVLLVLADSFGNVLEFVLHHDQVFGLARLIDLQREANIPTWFSSVQLFAVALTLTAIWLSQRNATHRHAPYWAVLMLGFYYLSVDEVAQLHEMSDNPLMTPILGAEHSWFHTTARTMAWAVLSVTIVVGLGLFFLRFLRELPPPTRRRFIVAGAVYCGGVVVMELIGQQLDAAIGRGLLRSFVTGFEETLEMSGIALFLYALLDYARTSIPGFGIGTTPVAGQPATAVTVPSGVGGGSLGASSAHATDPSRRA